MALTTNTTGEAWSPDVQFFPAPDVIADALILSTSTYAGSIEGDAPSVNVAYVDDAEAAFVAEGAPITEHDPNMATLPIFTSKVASLTRMSSEQYHQPTPGANSVSEAVRRAIIKQADQAYINAAAPTTGVPGNSTGLLNTTGILDGDPVDGSLDALVDLLAEVGSNDGNTTHLVLAPSTWAALRKVKTQTGSEVSLLGAGTMDAQPYLLGVPVVVSNAVPANTGLALDSTAVVSAYGQVQVATSEHAFFGSDSIALRSTFRLGWSVVHPDRIGKFTITV